MLSPFETRIPRFSYLFWSVLGAVWIRVVVGPASNPLLVILLASPVVIVGFYVVMGRLHDADLSEWWILLALVPVVNLFFWFALQTIPGTRGPNTYGPDPVIREPLREPRPRLVPSLRLDGWSGGEVRQCAGCGLGNAVLAHRCRECGASLSGTMPFLPAAPPD